VIHKKREAFMRYIYSIIILSVVIAISIFKMANNSNNFEVQSYFKTNSKVEIDSPGVSIKATEAQSKNDVMYVSKGTFDTVPKMEIKVKTIDDFKTEFNNLPAVQLQEIISSSRESVRSKKLIEKSNSSSLSEADANLLASQINKESAAKLILIDRKLEELRRKYL
jgi:hypothetical protein